MDSNQFFGEGIGRGMLAAICLTVGLPVKMFVAPSGPVILPLLLTALCLVTITYFYFRPVPLWDRITKRVVYCLPWLPPLLLMASLILLSWRGSILLGRWPQPFADDPSVICKDDALFQSLYNLSAGILDLVGGSIIVWCALTLHLGLRNLLTLRQVALLVMTTYVVWLLIALDPTLRLEWWFD